MSITVLEPGPLTTVQDAGAPATQRKGIGAAAQPTATPTGWAMHSWAIRRARRCWNVHCAA